MALDEALLESAAADGAPTLRFYAWEQPTLSLGYFQAHSDRQRHAASRNCTLVRRASGGGAILHDDELTYSLTLPPDMSRRLSPERLYRTVHGALIESLSELGVTATLYGCGAAEKTCRRGQAAEPFLCFQRRAPGDVLVGEVKIAGSAQRRRGGAALLHGSLLLARSTAAPELDGLCELTGDESWRRGGERSEALRRLWSEWIAVRLGLSLRGVDSAQATHTELRRANQLQAEKYGSHSWVQRR